MILRGSKIKLRPNMVYKDQPEKSEDVGTGENRLGKYQQLQVLDINDGADGRKKTGFFYVRIYTEIPLCPDDEVVVKEILFVQRKQNKCVIGITIEENNPYAVPEPEVNEFGTYDF